MLFRALIVDNNEAFVASMAHNLMTEFEADVVHVSNGKEALNLIKNEHTFDVIITRDKVGDENSALLIASELYEGDKKRFIFVIGSTLVVYKNLVIIDAKFRIEEFNRAIIKTLGLTREQLRSAKLPDYIAIPLKSFYFINSICCDVYIKLKRKNEDQYVKRILAGENLDRPTIERYELQGLNEFFIKKENREAFLNLLMGIGENDQPLYISKKYELQKELLEKFGLNEETMQLAQGYINEMKGQVFKNAKFGSLLKELLNNEGSYAYKHSQLICFFAGLVLPRLEIGKGKFFEVAMSKICYAAFFHDLLLKDDQHIKIYSKLGIYEMKLDDKSKDQVMNHANLMATMIQSQPNMPQDLDTIIRHHHGVPHGVGFAEVPNININPYAILFIVLEDFADRILHFDKNKRSIKEMFTDMNDKYSMPTYKKIIEALKMGTIQAFSS